MHILIFSTYIKKYSVAGQIIIKVQNGEKFLLPQKKGTGLYSVMCVSFKNRLLVRTGQEGEI